MQTLLQDLRYGARMLVKQPGFTLIAVVTLALGIGATTAIFSVVNSVLLQSLPYPRADRLVTVSLDDNDGEFGNTGYATFVDWQARAKSFEQLALIRSWGGVLTGQGDAEAIRGLRVTPEYFGLLGVAPALGRDFRTEENRPDTRYVLVISHGLWQRRFNADPNVVGRPLVFSGQTFTVVGVMPQGFEDLLAANFYQPAEVWGPLGYDLTQEWACRSCQHLKAFGRLKDGVTLEQARTEMNALAAALKQEHPTTYSVASAVVFGLQDEFTKGIRPALYLLLIAVNVLLLIACANVANLLLARATGRAREMAVRAALGAGRFRIIRQLLLESLLLAGLGAAAGLGLAVWGVDVLMALKPATLLRLQTVTIDTRVLTFAAAVSFLTGVLFGLAPAWHASKPDLQLALKTSDRGVSAGSRLRNIFVVSEIALALVLLVGAGLLLRSFVQLLAVKPGFEAGNLLTMMIPATGTRYDEDEPTRQMYRELVARVSKLPGVEAAGVVSNLPLSGNGDRIGFHLEARPWPNPADAPSVERYSMTPDYLRTMRIGLLRGRGFTEQDDANAPLVVLISQSAARRFWPNEDPLGRRVRLGGGEGRLRTIVGVVPDVLHQGLEDGPDIQAYVPHAQWVDASLRLAVRTAADPTSVLAAIRREVKTVDPNLSLSQIFTMEQLVARTTAQRRFTLLLAGVFAALSLLLAGLGIYSVIACSVAQRTRELGIRLALGAQTRDVLRLVIRQGMRLALIGTSFGLLGAWSVMRLMKSLLFGVSATDPLTFAAIALLLVSVALLACWIPARRATKVDPIIALRCE
jgi:putative ABC transport system permease protein